MSNQKFLLGHIVSKTATEFSYLKSSSFMKDITTENKLTFELGVGDGIDISIYAMARFMQKKSIQSTTSK